MNIRDPGSKQASAKTLPSKTLPDIIRPYGDTTGDGMVQVSFTLPIPHDKRAEGAALQLAATMGLAPALLVHARAMGSDFTFFIVYGAVSHLVDLREVVVIEREFAMLSAKDVNAAIKKRLHRKLVVVGACIGNDAHTVGIVADAGADHDELAVQSLLDRGVDVLGAQHRELALDHHDLAQVHQVADGTIDDEEGEVRAHRLGVDEQGRRQTHLGGQLERSALGPLVMRDGEGEGDLDHAVTGGVTVRPDDVGQDLRACIAGVHFPVPASNNVLAGLS